MRAIIIALVVMSLQGCAGLYDTSKKLYIGGKYIVVKHWEELPEDVQNRLEKVDQGLMEYDEVREDVKKYVIGE